MTLCGRMKARSIRTNAEGGPRGLKAGARVVRPLSLGRYLLIVFALSWPFQLAFVVLGETFRPILLLSMIMAGVGTFVAGRYVFTDGFEGTGWRWCRPGTTSSPSP